MENLLENWIASYHNKLLMESDNAHLFSKIGEFYYLQGKYEEALLACQQALQLQPNVTTPLAKVLMALGHTEVDNRSDPDSHYGFDNWIWLDTSSVTNYPDGINQLCTGVLDGIIVKNLFSEAEIDQAVQKIETSDDYNPILTDFGALLGFPISFYGIEKINYFQESFPWRNKLNELFQGRFEARLKEILFKLSGQRAIELLGEDTDRQYVPAVVRSFYPQQGGLRVHTDQEFFERPDSVGIVLRQIAKLFKAILSYIVIVQKPEKGGELILYDLTWEQTPQYIKESATTAEKEAFLERFNSRKLTPDVGDLVIFNAMQRWHQVSDVSGTRKRITVGGEISISKDDRKIVYWS